MAGRSVKDSPLAMEIWEGKHDGDIELIQLACAARLKGMFRKGAKVRLVGTRNPELDGKIGTVLKVNPKRVSVGVGTLQREGSGDFSYEVWSDGEFNVPPAMLQVITAAEAAA